MGHRRGTTSYFLDREIIKTALTGVSYRTGIKGDTIRWFLRRVLEGRGCTCLGEQWTF
jgi:hypothetical protein